MNLERVKASSFEVVQARDLVAGDWVFPEPYKSNRPRKVSEVRRNNGTLPIEVRLEGFGTWNYDSRAEVCIKPR